ncbi:hypothetical protein [Gloeocapsopsis dulcis]|uniref:hypothetical protein n=1 Tax=Gloeocapsopsis dulcis TaxID=2859516 RepID=UPI0012DAE1C8|nr:hypothetical protein [Gloeocapsopsis dulcis]WNN90508.1 hypothetical protein P0S91_05340 [Gloeocapsopsis dulcis]
MEAWRSYGFVVFAGLFSLLAFQPRHYAGVSDPGRTDRYSTIRTNRSLRLYR